MNDDGRIQMRNERKWAISIFEMWNEKVSIGSNFIWYLRTIYDESTEIESITTVAPFSLSTQNMAFI